MDQKKEKKWNKIQIEKPKLHSMSSTNHKNQNLFYGFMQIYCENVTIKYLWDGSSKMRLEAGNKLKQKSLLS